MADETVTKHPFEDEVASENGKRAGKGTRLRYGMTRGKGSLPIKWEAFDESKPDTLPNTLEEFISIVKATKDNLLEWAIVGYNDAQYTAASDPIAEHVNPVWDDDTKSQFRLVVRNYSKATGVSIDEAVTLVKPGVDKAFSAKKK